MAYKVGQIYPNDLNPSKAIGFDLPINGKAVFPPNYQTKDAIKNNLINYLLTNPGERPDNPEFGGGLRKFVFSQIQQNNLQYLKEDVQNKISNNFPNVNILELNVLSQEDKNTITVQIIYNIPNTNINDQLELNFN
jgi:phage baseplate assembly protein W